MPDIPTRFIMVFFWFFVSVLRSAASIPDTVDLTSSNLPIVIIDTWGNTIIDSARIDAEMGIIDNGEGAINYITDEWNGYDGKISIELRGTSSMGYPKKQYRFETKDEWGYDSNVVLLDMPVENDWILNGPYDDQSLLRNVLAYELSNDMRRYSSRTRYCEMVLNGIYQGIFILMEKIKRDKNRVNISSMNDTCISGNAVTGGYIIKIDNWNGESVGGWTSVNDIEYQYDYPKPRNIIPEQEAYIQNYMNEFETVMESEDFNHPIDGYAKYIDVISFADHFILNEFCKNIDAYRISCFMHKDRDDFRGKLIAGPLWDFNLSFGKAWFSDDMYVTEGWQVDYDTTHPDDEFKVPFWWEKLVTDTLFMEKVKMRWQQFRKHPINKASLFKTIDTWTDINTFKTSKIIRFGLSRKSPVTIILYTLSGKKVSTLLDSEKDKGYHTTEFNPTLLPSGIYFCTLQTSTWSNVKKVELVK
jgi:hypothetical protein